MCQASVNPLPRTSSRIELRNYTTQTDTNLILVNPRRQYKRRCNPQLKQGKSISHHFLIIPPYSSVPTFYTILRHPFLKDNYYLLRQRWREDALHSQPWSGFGVDWYSTEELVAFLGQFYLKYSSFLLLTKYDLYEELNPSSTYLYSFVVQKRASANRCDRDRSWPSMYNSTSLEVKMLEKLMRSPHVPEQEWCLSLGYSGGSTWKYQ